MRSRANLQIWPEGIYVEQSSSECVPYSVPQENRQLTGFSPSSPLFYPAPVRAGYNPVRQARLRDFMPVQGSESGASSPSPLTVSIHFCNGLHALTCIPYNMSSNSNIKLSKSAVICFFVYFLFPVDKGPGRQLKKTVIMEKGNQSSAKPRNHYESSAQCLSRIHLALP